MSKFGSRTTTTSSSAESNSGSKEPKNITLFDLREIQVTDKSGNKVKKLKIQLPKGMQLVYKGTPVELGEYNSLILKDIKDIEDDLSFLVEKEYMTLDQANDRANFIQEKNVTHEAKTKNPKIS